MSDIVSRLRSLSRYEHDDLAIGDEAADVIVRLTKAIEDSQGVLEVAQGFDLNCEGMVDEQINENALALKEIEE